MPSGGLKKREEKTEGLGETSKNLWDNEFENE